MLNRNILFFFFLLLACLAPSFSLAKGNATILIYHRFGDDRYPTTNVSNEAFSEQMNFLRDNGYKVIPFSELVTLIKNNTNIPEKTVVITIDDSYATVYENAWPVLKKHGYPFSVFVYTKGVDRHYGDYMNWSQLRELKEYGVDIQDHSFGHKHLAFRQENMDEFGYRAWISGDLAKSMALFFKRTG